MSIPNSQIAKSTQLSGTGLNVEQLTPNVKDKADAVVADGLNQLIAQQKLQNPNGQTLDQGLSNLLVAFANVADRLGEIRLPSDTTVPPPATTTTPAATEGGPVSGGDAGPLTASGDIQKIVDGGNQVISGGNTPKVAGQSGTASPLQSGVVAAGGLAGEAAAAAARGMPGVTGAAGGPTVTPGGPVQGANPAGSMDEKTALTTLRDNYDRFEHDKNGYITVQGLYTAANDPKQPPQVRQAAAYLCNNQDKLNKLETARERNANQKADNYDGLISREDFDAELKEIGGAGSATQSKPPAKTKPPQGDTSKRQAGGTANIPPADGKVDNPLAGGIVDGLADRIAT